jgi:hypothetical protein
LDWTKTRLLSWKKTKKRNNLRKRGRLCLRNLPFFFFQSRARIAIHSAVAMECAICMEEMVPDVELCPKRHAVCSTCRLRIQRPDCPICLPHKPHPHPPPHPPQAAALWRGLAHACVMIITTVMITILMVGGVLVVAYTGKGIQWFSWSPGAMYVIDIMMGLLTLGVCTVSCRCWMDMIWLIR